MTRPLTILFDKQIFEWQTMGGIQRYFAEIVGGLGGRPGVTVRVPVPVPRNDALARCRAVGSAGPLVRFLERSERLTRLANALACRHALRRGRFDVAHLTYHDAAPLAHLGGKPFVVTIHDLIPEILGDRFPSLRREIDGRRELVAGAARLIAVSERTKADLVACYGVDPGRVETIHHGVSAATICPPGRARPNGVPDRFILYVGRRDGYKNFAGAAPAIARVLRRVPGLRLLCVGGGPFTAEEQGVLDGSGCRERIVQAALSDADLAGAYAQAAAFVLPSLYEGFGMPLLEAFANGCPVVASDRGAIPEVAGEAALLFDPEAPADLEAALERVLADRTVRARLVAAGRLRAAQFSWDRATTRHLLCYEKAAARVL